jgi:TolB-like protein/Flp pilus assembly protein TadD
MKRTLNAPPVDLGQTEPLGLSCSPRRRGEDLPRVMLPVTEPSRAVFLSYASQDAEAARRICDALRAASIEVWFDQSELRGGDAWDHKIRKQIHDCALFIPIISTHTQARTEGYFRLEWHLADQRKLLMTKSRPFLVPVCIDDTPDADAEVPDSFVTVQWTRLPAGETPPTFAERVSRLLSPEPAQASPLVESRAAAAPHIAFRQPASSSAASGPTQHALLVIAALAIIGVSYFAVDKFILSKHPAIGAPTSISAEQSNAPAHSAIPERSIAVLPFVDMSEKHDQEYLGDGIAEEILNLLVKLPDLKVIGRTSSFQFKGKTEDLRAIGSKLGVAYIVEGSVRRSGDHVRVTAQLVDARDGAHRWSETYDRNADDVLKVQSEVAASLAKGLNLEVAAALGPVSRSSLRSSSAYDIFLRGMHAQNRTDRDGFEEAVADYRRALQFDPSFAPAAAQLAMVLRNLAQWGYVPPRTGYEQSRAAAEAALQLDPGSAIAHRALSLVHLEFDWDWQGSERELKTAAASAPNDPGILQEEALLRVTLGQWSEAERLTAASLAANPLDAAPYNASGFIYLHAGRFADAEHAFRRVLEITPTFSWGHYLLGVALLVEGKPEEGLSEMQREPVLDARIAGMPLAYHALHRTKESDAALAQLEAANAQDGAMQIAEAYAFRDNKDQAFKWLERAYSQKDVDVCGVKYDVLLANLRGDARYTAFLRKMNLPE